MSEPMHGRSMAEMLRAEGVRVAEHPGWMTHNRNHKGPWGEVNGIMIHHTVTPKSADAVKICHDGYAQLPGPLCHGVIERDGVVHLISSGRANHAGGGDPAVLTAVTNEYYDVRPPAPRKHDGQSGTADGNRAFYGFECANLGDGTEEWPEVQVEAMVRAAAAFARYHGWSAKSIIGHSEWSDWKSDPKGPKTGPSVAMPDLRRRVQERLNHEPNWSRPGSPTPPAGPVTPPKPPVLKDDHMEPIDFWNYRNVKADEASVKAGHGRIPDAYGYVVLTHGTVAKLLEAVKDTRAEVARLSALINKLAK